MIQIGSLADVIADAEHVKENGCYNYTNNGKCSKCGSCCSTLLPLKKSEITRLKQLIKERHIKPHEQPKVVMAIDLTCPFLTDIHECSIYDERPFICKVFKCDSKPTYDDYMAIDEPLISTDVRSLF